jgi:hypothetical protein
MMLSAVRRRMFIVIHRLYLVLSARGEGSLLAEILE